MTSVRKLAAAAARNGNLAVARSGSTARRLTKIDPAGSPAPS
jgi:hypothetical protein